MRNKSAWRVTFSFGLSFQACIRAVSQFVSFAQFRAFSLPHSLTIMSIGGIASAIISFILLMFIHVKDVEIATE